MACTFHERVFIKSPWAHIGATEFVAMADPNSTEPYEELHGLVTVNIGHGAANIVVKATPEKLRELAALLTAAADAKEAM